MVKYEVERLRELASSFSPEEQEIFIDVFMQSKIEVPSCPCCGGAALFMGTAWPRIVCTSCGLTTAEYETSVQALEAWSKRSKK